MDQILTLTQFNASLHTDALNLSHGRNRRNTPPKFYNCGGLALSVFHWVTPYLRTDNTFQQQEFDDDEYTDEARIFLMEDLYDQGCTNADIEEIITETDCQFLLRHYPFLTSVTIDECAPSDPLIAYRIFIRMDPDEGIVADTDFHFLVRYHGVWFEKMGTENITVSHPDLTSTGKWSYTAETEYTGPIHFFKPSSDFKI